MSDIILADIKLTIQNGNVILDLSCVDPKELRDTLKEYPSMVGTWRVVDRLKSCVEAINKDWDTIFGA